MACPFKASGEQAHEDCDLGSAAAENPNYSEGLELIRVPYKMRGDRLVHSAI